MRGFVGLLVILYLAGCAEITVPVEPAPPPETVIEEAPEEVPKEVIAPPKPRFMVENLLALAPGTVRNILGKASLERAEKDARVWMYHNSQCVLQLYFYPDDLGDFRLDYVAAEGQNTDFSAEDCLDSHLIPPPSSGEKNKDPLPDRSDN